MRDGNEYTHPAVTVYYTNVILELHSQQFASDVINVDLAARRSKPRSETVMVTETEAEEERPWIFSPLARSVFSARRDGPRSGEWRALPVV